MTEPDLASIAARVLELTNLMAEDAAAKGEAARLAAAGMEQEIERQRKLIEAFEKKQKEIALYPCWRKQGPECKTAQPEMLCPTCEARAALAASIDASGREWRTIQADGITVAEGYVCEKCGVVGCTRHEGIAMSDTQPKPEAATENFPGEQRA